MIDSCHASEKRHETSVRISDTTGIPSARKDGRSSQAESFKPRAHVDRKTPLACCLDTVGDDAAFASFVRTLPQSTQNHLTTPKPGHSAWLTPKQDKMHESPSTR